MTETLEYDGVFEAPRRTLREYKSLAQELNGLNVERVRGLRGR